MAKTVKLLQGNEACAQGAVYAGCRFFAGYPITPSSEIAEILAASLPRVGGRFIQMEDELASIAAIIGASLAGKKSMTATSGPGFSLMQENIGFACITEIPVVIVNVMRGGPSTGMPTAPGQGDIMQAKWGTQGDHPAVTMAPDSVGEFFTETIRAFNAAEKLRTPVIVLTDEIVAHTREKVEIPEPGEIPVEDRIKPSVGPADYKPYDTKFGDVPPMANFGDGYRFHVTGLVHAEDGFPTNEPDIIESQERRIIRKVEEAVPWLSKNEEFMLGDAEVALVAVGSTARAAKMAAEEAREKGVRAGVFRPVTLWPFPHERLKELAGSVKRIIVAEMNLGQIVGEVERSVCGSVEVTCLNQVNGESISPRSLCSAMVGEVQP
ncbi:MAG: 2-oxoacid:acceptor oxidoreductase subunit alpha [Deltaproteobacteria bacterium]|nr:2-oxoacid:acceptor oxidoreductase subunit alpha [Deltaproteobacteria bacterium]